MAEVCNRGHELTEDNIAWHKRGDRPGYRKRCLACKRESYNSNGQPTVYVKAGRLTTDLHEDIEDLLNFGATYKEILSRAGFSGRWDTMYRSLKRRDRWDLIERLREKKAKDEGRGVSSIIPAGPTKSKRDAGSIRFTTYAGKH